jgi:hypothetical protein
MLVVTINLLLEPGLLKTIITECRLRPCHLIQSFHQGFNMEYPHQCHLLLTMVTHHICLLLLFNSNHLKSLSNQLPQNLNNKLRLSLK